MDTSSLTPGYFSNKTILTLLAHPDDEVLGCGGTLIRAVEEGATVHCYIPVKRIAEDCEKAMDNIGVSTLHFGDWEDNSIDKRPLLDLCKFFSKAVGQIKPDFIFTHFHNCTNIDHRYCYEAAIVANSFTRATMLMCEIPSSTGYLKPCHFDPNFYITIKPEHFVKKLHTLGIYGTEEKQYPHPRCFEKIRCLHETRGAECNSKYAEAFVLVRKVI
ncbi:MAG: PIG-L family deacetylase [Candidatus Paceibacterota bacterium]